ncbi:MAG: hypothetical protein WC823_06835 [Parcubacteria group bacterium]|jgi:hypothetical protein
MHDKVLLQNDPNNQNRLQRFGKKCFIILGFIIILGGFAAIFMHICDWPILWGLWIIGGTLLYRGYSKESCSQATIDDTSEDYL